MQVVVHTSNELVVHDGRWHSVILGAVLFALGGGALWLVSTYPEGGSGSPWVAYVVGTVFVLGGCLIFWMSADRKFVIDKSARTVSLVVQRLVHRQARLLAFGDIDDVVLEESSGVMTQSNARGAAKTAYVDPANAARAFLVPRISLIPLIFVAIPLVFGLLFAWIIRKQRAQVAYAGNGLVPVVQTA